MKKSIFFNQCKSDRIFNIVVYSFIFIISLIIFYPLYFTVIASFSNPDMVASGQVILLPRGVTWEGYKYILRDQRIWLGYFNTIRYAFFGTLIALFITIPAGYALSRKDMRGRGFIMKAVMFTKYFSGGLIPTYLIVKKLNLVDTPYVLMILGSFSVFNLIVCRTFFANTISLELQEAAEMDGCGIGRFFFSIVLPLSKAIIAIMALYYAVGHWNSFFNSLIYVNNASLYPLQLILRDILILGQTVQADVTDPDMLQQMRQISKTIKYGVIIVSSLPVLCLYPLAQKYFVKGVMVGSIKG